MVAHKPIRVRAKPGHFVLRKGSLEKSFVGRRYDPKGNTASLETEFPIIAEGEEVPFLRYRAEMQNGELEQFAGSK
jgi:hypothetical protein